MERRSAGVFLIITVPDAPSEMDPRIASLFGTKDFGVCCLKLSIRGTLRIGV